MMNFNSDWVLKMFQLSRDEFQEKIKKNCTETKEFYSVLRQMELEENQALVSDLRKGGVATYPALI